MGTRQKVRFWLHDEKGLRRLSWWSSLKLRFGPQRYQFGSVSDITVWKIALSAEEIKKEYDSGRSLTEEEVAFKHRGLDANRPENVWMFE